MSTIQTVAGAMVTLAAIVAGVVFLNADPPAPEVGQVAIIERVIDGDTFTATTAGGDDLGRIRVLGMDAPELARDGNPEQCYAQEATDAAKQLLEGQTVQISADRAEGERDRYDRLLAYVDVEGTDFAQVMLSEGHARLYEGSPLARRETYNDAAGSAQDGNVGLWAEC